MNFLQLCQQFMRDTGTHGDLTSVVSQTGEFRRVIEWIKRADREICNKWQDWRFLWAEGTITTVASTDSYSPPADLRIWQEDSFYIDDKQLYPVYWDDYRRTRFSTDDTGEPDSFTIKPDRDVLLLPTPDDVYTINFEYSKTYSELAMNTDESLIPSQHRDIIIHRAIMYWARYEEAQLEYQQAAQDFAEWMLRLEAEQLPTFDNAHGRAEGVDIVVTPDSDTYGIRGRRF